MIENLFLKKYLHDLRIQNIINKSNELGCDDFSDVVVWIDLIKNIPFTFDNGETWIASKVEFIQVKFTGKYSGDYFENHIKVYFKSSEKKRCVYFSCSESKNGKIVLNLFQEYFKKEIYGLTENTPILDAIEEYLINTE